MSGCKACDAAEIPPKTDAMLYAEALIREHHRILLVQSVELRVKTEFGQALLDLAGDHVAALLMAPEAFATDRELPKIERFKAASAALKEWASTQALLAQGLPP